uniref:Sodium/hydrogen exchanger n=1 Tax=Oreochromis niloticus TaxID=8128 RepID=I3KML0_ORENI
MVLGLAHDVASSNHPSPPTAHATNISSNGTGRIFPLLHLDYGKVQISFEVALWILLASLMKLGFQRLPHLSTHVPDRCLFIVVGLMFGGLFRAGGQEVPQIVQKLFFLCLLPPIVLDAGYFLPIEPLLENLGRVLLFGFVGSIWNALFVGGILYGVCKIGKGSTVLTNTGLLQCLLFGSITSAVDSAAVFEKIQMKEILHILLFGESILSDAVAVVLYHLYHEFYVTASVTFLKIFLGVIAFSLAGLGVILVGSCYGILTAYTTRFTSNTGIVEPLVVFLYCNMAYLSAEMFNLSGIIALIACCFVMRPFVQANISCESEMTIKYFLNMWSRFNESLIFIFVGVVTVAGPQVWNWTFITLTVILCVVARVIAVVGVTFMTNKFHTVNQTKEDQFLVACSGLRGAVAFSLGRDFRKNRLFMDEKNRFSHATSKVCAVFEVKNLIKNNKNNNKCQLNKSYRRHTQ